jgi:hypothetical protein
MYTKLSQFRFAGDSVAESLIEEAEKASCHKVQSAVITKPGIEFTARSAEDFKINLSRSKAVHEMLRKNYAHIEHKDWEAHLWPLPSEYSGHRLADNYVCYQLMLVSDRPEGELQRFYERFSDAIAGLRKHCNDVTEKSIRDGLINTRDALRSWVWLAEKN